MATVGLRAANYRRPLAHFAVAVNSRQLCRQAWLRPPVLASPAIAFRRHYAQEPHRRFVMQEFGLFSHYIPQPWSTSPSVFTKAGRESLIERIREGVRSFFGVLNIKFRLPGWKKSIFAMQAEELYNTMNEAYAKGDIKLLKEICSPDMYAKLKREISNHNRVFDWELVSSQRAPEISHICCARFASGYMFAQVVVRVDQKQKVTLHSKNAEPVSKTMHVIEYLVFQRQITESSSPWWITGKLKAPSWDQPAN
ncbi:hypothetical protein H4R24_001838 [Coemansia sp. RSA 988]|nr:hypothetical protein H4R24_001838 [Coemansia sp. RSA 988]